MDDRRVFLSAESSFNGRPSRVFPDELATYETQTCPCLSSGHRIRRRAANHHLRTRRLRASRLDKHCDGRDHGAWRERRLYLQCCQPGAASVRHAHQCGPAEQVPRRAGGADRQPAPQCEAFCCLLKTFTLSAFVLLACWLSALLLL